MARTPSTMLPLGTLAPEFALKEPRTDSIVSLDEVSGAHGTLVAFICNHCPYVIHVMEEFRRLQDDFVHRGLGMVAVNSNDVDNYPQDGPDKMAQLAEQQQWDFPFLYDADQSVAQAYKAACTPDFYVFDGERRLVYRGQLDGSRPGNDIPVTGADLRGAIEQLLAGQPVGADQKPSLGCNIKWKPANEPEYFSRS